MTSQPPSIVELSPYLNNPHEKAPNFTQDISDSTKWTTVLSLDEKKSMTYLLSLFTVLETFETIIQKLNNATNSQTDVISTIKLQNILGP